MRDSEKQRVRAPTFYLAIGQRTFGGRALREWHVDEYLRKAAYRPQRALRWLLRCAFPWRLSYLLRGDPVHLVVHGGSALQDHALAELLAAVRPAGEESTALSARLIDRAMNALHGRSVPE